MQFHEAARFFADVPHVVVSEATWRGLDEARGMHVAAMGAEYVFVDATRAEIRDRLEAAGCVIASPRANSAPSTPTGAGPETGLSQTLQYKMAQSYLTSMKQAVELWNAFTASNPPLVSPEAFVDFVELAVPRGSRQVSAFNYSDMMHDIYVGKTTVAAAADEAGNSLGWNVARDKLGQAAFYGMPLAEQRRAASKNVDTYKAAAAEIFSDIKRRGRPRSRPQAHSYQRRPTGFGTGVARPTKPSVKATKAVMLQFLRSAVPAGPDRFSLFGKPVGEMNKAELVRAMKLITDGL